MIKKKPASPHLTIEMKNATLAWDSSHSSIQNSPKLTPKTKKDKRAARGKKEKVRQLQRTEHQAVLAEQKGHLLLDSDERPSPEEDEGKHIHLGSLRLQRTLYNIDLEIEEVTTSRVSSGEGGCCRSSQQSASCLGVMAGSGSLHQRANLARSTLEGILRNLTIEINYRNALMRYSFCKQGNEAFRRVFLALRRFDCYSYM